MTVWYCSAGFAALHNGYPLNEVLPVGCANKEEGKSLYVCPVLFWFSGAQVSTCVAMVN